MRVGVVDIGTNSTRLLIADVVDGRVAAQLDRRSEVTRLGAGVDASGRLDDGAIARVFTVLDAYRAAIDEQRCELTTAVLTSAVRDAANGADFTAQVRERYDLPARTIDGDEEARLTFLGATSERPESERQPLLVIDIGGGSTEFVLGQQGRVAFHVSTQAGVVRQSERHLHSDPPEADELRRLSEEMHEIVATAVPEAIREQAATAIGVAGTATACAAIAQGLDPYDSARVHGYVLSLLELEQLLVRLAAIALARRREVAGLHPDRAPTIVAGIAIMIEALRAFGLEQVEVSEHDILRGAALACVREPEASGAGA
ncbi:MAG TPA: Ppx/GppA family phosphatase [Solirubrobacteraceae bacterium]|nr:Ppx/GppA family phosphatase [Solirubrobacteraceae bacterium]